MNRQWLRGVLVAGVPCALAGLVNLAAAGTLHAELERSALRRSPQGDPDVAVIVRFRDSLNGASMANNARSRRNNEVVAALKKRAASNRAGIDALLREAGATQTKELWAIQALAVTVPVSQVRRLAAHPAVDRVDPDSLVQGTRTQRMPPSRAEAGGRSGVPPLAEPLPALTLSTQRLMTARPGWNIAAVHAPQVWAHGFSGQGVVVASMDTGADLSHPDLRSKWRGGSNSWFDPHAQEASPYDATGHGTQALGIINGDPEIGVAPNARWIAVRLFNDQGRASMSDIHRAFQWLLDPDGDPATSDAPDVVNASWALSGRGVGSCILEFSDDIRVLRSAGIAVVFAAGNDGPRLGTSNSPGNNPGVVSVGATDSDGEVARQTSRGPSACAGVAFPTLMAPGVNVRTADLSHGGQPSYTSSSGSSLAAPHVSGVLALLAGAFPDASVDELESAVLRSAQPLKPSADDGHDGANDRYVDALAAFRLLQGVHRSASSGSALMGP